MSSSYRELMAVLLVLKGFQSFIAEKEVTIFSDNQNVVRIVHNGSSVGHLQRIAVDIFSFCLSNNVSFQAQWIPRAENQLADYLRTFAPIVSAHPYCARKFTRHVIHERAR